MEETPTTPKTDSDQKVGESESARKKAESKSQEGKTFQGPGTEKKG